MLPAFYLLHMILFWSLNAVLVFIVGLACHRKSLNYQNQITFLLDYKNSQWFEAESIPLSAKIKFYIQLQYIALTYKTVFNPATAVNLLRRQILLPFQSDSSWCFSVEFVVPTKGFHFVLNIITSYIHSHTHYIIFLFLIDKKMLFSIEGIKIEFNKK